MKMILIKKILLKRRGYKLIEDAYGHYGVFDKWGTLIRYFLTEQELFQWIRLIKFLGLLRR